MNFFRTTDTTDTTDTTIWKPGLKAKKNYSENRIKDQINIPRPIHRNVCYCYNESPHLGVGRLRRSVTHIAVNSRDVSQSYYGL